MNNYTTPHRVGIEIHWCECTAGECRTAPLQQATSTALAQTTTISVVRISCHAGYNRAREKHCKRRCKRVQKPFHTSPRTKILLIQLQAKEKCNVRTAHTHQQHWVQLTTKRKPSIYFVLQTAIITFNKPAQTKPESDNE